MNRVCLGLVGPILLNLTIPSIYKEGGVDPAT